MLLDTVDFDTPFADHDALIECTALDEVEYESPDDWPAWCDADRWEPTPDDVAWFNHEPYQPTDADWDDLYQASYGGFTDEDLAAGGLAVG